MRIRLDLLAAAAAAAMGLPITAHAAVDSFIWFEGEQGNTTDARHKGWFEIKQLSMAAPGQTAMATGSGAGTGKVKHGEFTITRKVDSASPVLFQKAMVSGKHFPMVKIEMRKAGGDPHQYMTYTFTDVQISKMNMSGTGKEGPEESITFVYGGMKVEYANQASDGQTGPAPAPVKGPAPPPSRSPQPPR